MSDAVRLIFSQDGDDLRLVSQQRVDVAVDFDRTEVEQSGYFVELRDLDNHMLGRVRAQKAFSPSIEVFSESQGEPIIRREVSLPTQAFTVIVPIPEAARQIAVVHLQPPAERQEPVASSAPRGDAERNHEVSDIVVFPLELGPGETL